MFNKLKEIITKNKELLFKIAIFLGIYFLLSDFSFAAESTAATATSNGELDSDTKSKIIEAITWISTIISVFLGLLTYLVTIFLSPEWITGSIFGISSKLKEIWILISNVVYFAFAFILIYIAFMNIVGAGGQDYEFKSALPKFIVGILIVPFSWFLVNFMVTFSSILTIAALNLPFDTFSEYKSNIGKVEIPSECTINLNSLSNSKSGTSESATQTNKIFYCGDEKKPLSEIMKTDKSADGIFGIISLYNYGLLNLEGVSNLDSQSLNDTIKTMGDVVVKVVFDLIFIIVYALLMIALGLALMIRGIRLWLYMMLSPLFGLMHFFGKGKEGFFEKFNLMEFLHLCMVPVYTMLALSFGMLFIYQIGDKIEPGSLNNSSIKISDDKKTLILNDGFKLKIEGEVSGSNAFGKLKDTAGTATGVGLGIIGSLILKIFGVVILWGTVIAALSKSEITKTMIQPIASFGDQVGKMAQTLPQYTPILPGGQSLQSLERLPGVFQGELQKNVNEQTTRAGKLLGIEKSDIRELIEELKSNASFNKGDSAAVADARNRMAEIGRRLGIEQALRNSEYQELANQIGEKKGVTFNFNDIQKFSQSMADLDLKLNQNDRNIDFSSSTTAQAYFQGSSSGNNTLSNGNNAPSDGVNSQPNIILNNNNTKITLGNQQVDLSNNGSTTTNVNDIVQRIKGTNIPVDKDMVRSELEKVLQDKSKIDEIINQL